ncbi:hypothetical protein KL933_003106 [Ogataea haglerorum]|uniref:Leukotriene A(4) hydrolase n=1 Tax=Ogataea haglerorum TaxID=1937702 RepID=A0AAN6D5D5_9ASCO|nr:hypothetical protein KL913_004001 [Ogataea haglerorum]KAG7715666.1 hypothetical protein KL949_004083 [Ogataea haglerorum]KAG7726823.1 hypothetical protein KL933_003106 [Ogataea haglerorum]KAG7760583.1 hypothetical protein KL947_000554 [Ogataea haglerorum]
MSTNYPNISPKLWSIIAPHVPKSSPEQDPSTLSSYHEFKVEKSILDLKVKFYDKILDGSVIYIMKPLVDTKVLVLDTAHLKIKNVRINDAIQSFELKPTDGPLGVPLYVSYDFRAGDGFKLEISYETTKNGTALQWLEPPQTDGKKLPYLFSQCEAIHARSFFPCFDTPSVKSPFEFNIQSSLPVLMSGLLSKKTPLEDGSTLYNFYQPVPIPSYLCSIASGDLKDAPIGPRSRVWTEPSFLEDCQNEFKDDTENFIKTAESLVFEYEWKDYDVLVLPQSMPFGGMEHPNCTFATPTLISGDKENVDVIAHELSHSWAGNLVTNGSFEHFWLNEGWTVYLERRILERLHGEKHRHFSSIIGWTDLENSIAAMGSAASKYSKLVLSLKHGDDPDDSFSTVPYEKGFNLLFHIEQTLGSKEAFDPFIKHYFKKFKYKSLDTYQFLDTLYEFYSDKKDLLDTIDWETWLYAPGLPPKPNFDTTLADECFSLAGRWIKVISSSPSSLESNFSPSDIENFTSNQNGVFLDKLVSYQNQDGFDWSSKNGQKAIGVMKKKYTKYENSSNAEVLFRWFRLLLTAQIQSEYQKLADWLGTVGRMKFVRPGYVLLNEADRELAVATFKKYEQSYHPICKAMVMKDLGLN